MFYLTMRTKFWTGALYSIAVLLFVNGGHSSPIIDDSISPEHEYPGPPANIDDSPWQLSLVARLEGGGVSVCGAALLSRSWALTTAHCMHRATSATVLSGSNSWMSMMLGREGIQLPVLWYTSHPGYSPGDGDLIPHNLALLRLSTDGIDVGDLHPILLPFPSEVNIKLEGKKVTVTGWGATSGYSHLQSRHLQRTELRVLKGDECAEAYGSDVARPGVMCGVGLHSGAAGICLGDSGVAVSYRKGKHTYLVGIAEFRDPSCASEAPTGFITVNMYLSWISTVTGITP